MAIFSKFKAAKERTQPKPEPEGPVERKPYIPQYAVRDALQCAPSHWKKEDPEIYRKANEIRIARQNSEMSMGHWSNPKMTPRMSRASSYITIAPTEGSRPHSRRHSTSYAGMMPSHSNAPGMMTDSPPVPSIPVQYASPATSPGSSSPRSSSRLSGHQIGNLTTNIDAQLPHEQPPKSTFRHSYFGQGSSTKRSSPLTSVESSSLEQPANHDTRLSSTASTSSTSSGEPIEMNYKHDSPQMANLPRRQDDRIYPGDPRRLGKAPMINIEEQPRRYFTHPTPPTGMSPPVPAAPSKPRFSLIRRRPREAVAAH